MHPPIERRGALLAPAARLDPHGVRQSLGNISQANFLFNEEPGETNAMRLTLRFLPFIHIHSFGLHNTFLL
jgi:hypothetical protein